MLPMQTTPGERKLLPPQKRRAEPPPLLQRRAMLGRGGVPLRRAALVLAACLPACAGTTPKVAPNAFEHAPMAAPEPAPLTSKPQPVGPVEATFVPATTAAPTDAESHAQALADERSWREQLANASDPTEAALALAAMLVAEERCAEALTVIDTALQRVRPSALRVARAGLWRDLGQRHLAVSELRALRRDAGAGAMHARVLLELAELEWLEGERDAAAATLRELQAEHGTDARWHELAAGHQRLADEIAAGTHSRMRIRDLLGNLRGAPIVTERMAVLAQLLAVDQLNERERADLCERVLAITFADESPAVRARALQLANVAPELAHDVCAAGLTDEAALVRQVAVDRAIAWLGSGARDLLLTSMACEGDPAAFRTIDGALAGLFGGLFGKAPSEPAAADTAEGRARILAAWRTRLVPADRPRTP